MVRYRKYITIRETGIELTFKSITFLKRDETDKRKTKRITTKRL